MMKRRDILKVVENKRIGADYALLKLSGKAHLPEMLPGQFVEIKIDNCDTFLRRPISIHDVDPAENALYLLVQIVGRGTETLSKLPVGSVVDVIFPLGTPFSDPLAGSKPLLIGGGCGMAPLLFLARRLKSKGLVPDILLGFRDVNGIVEYDKYMDLGRVFVTTEDGSFGVKGYVTDHPAFKSSKHDVFYCCGPEPMMKAVARYSKENHIRCEVSLENIMGCGIGVCLCCVVDSVDGNVCVCTDGPVFNVDRLKW